MASCVREVIFVGFLLGSHHSPLHYSSHFRVEDFGVLPNVAHSILECLKVLRRADDFTVL